MLHSNLTTASTTIPFEHPAPPGRAIGCRCRRIDASYNGSGDYARKEVPGHSKDAEFLAKGSRGPTKLLEALLNDNLGGGPSSFGRLVELNHSSRIEHTFTIYVQPDHNHTNSCTAL
jgi:hypothetical protein